MAIPLKDFQNPRFIRYKEGPTLSRDERARYESMPYGGDNVRAWRQSPLTGYNSSYPSTQALKVDFNRSDYTLPPRAR